MGVDCLQKIRTRAQRILGLAISLLLFPACQGGRDGGADDADSFTLPTNSSDEGGSEGGAGDGEFGSGGGEQGESSGGEEAEDGDDTKFDVGGVDPDGVDPSAALPLPQTCEEAAEAKTSVGCTFYPINPTDSWFEETSYVVTNVSPNDATVSLSTINQTLSTVVVPPGDSITSARTTCRSRSIRGLRTPHS